MNETYTVTIEVENEAGREVFLRAPRTRAAEVDSLKEDFRTKWARTGDTIHYTVTAD